MPSIVKECPTFGLIDLPDRALQCIARHVLCLAPDGALRPGSRGLKAAVVLARTHKRLRRAAGAAVREIRLGRSSATPAWPAARVLGPTAPAPLRVLDVAVDRARVVGLLRWLGGADGDALLRVLHLRVVGEPYARDALCDLEKLLLGRFFTRSGHAIQSLVVSGVDTHALLVSAACRCTALTRFELEQYDAREPSPHGVVSSLSPINACLCLIICLVNRNHLTRFRIPACDLRRQDQAAEKQPTDEEDNDHGQALSDLLENVWSTLWGNYRAGVKEAAANLPAEASELAAIFRTVSARMDIVDASMRATLLLIRDMAPNLHGDSVPLAMLAGLAPNLTDINLVLLPRQPAPASLARLAALSGLRILRFEEQGTILSAEDIVALRASLPSLRGLAITFASPGGQQFVPPSTPSALDDAVASHAGTWERICTVVDSVCSVFAGVLLHLGLDVAGPQSSILGLRAAMRLAEIPPGIEMLELSVDGCLEFVSLCAILSRHGPSLRCCRFASVRKDDTDVVMARRQCFLAFARYCQPCCINEITLPHWMHEKEELVEKELQWALYVTSRLPPLSADNNCNTAFGVLDAARYKSLLIESVATLPTDQPVNSVALKIDPTKIWFTQ